MRRLILTTLLLLGIATSGYTQHIDKSITKISGKQAYKTTLGEDNDEVIIGDEKASQFTAFKPQVKMWRWNKENLLSIKVSNTLIPNASTSSVGKELIHKNHKIGFYFKQVDDDSFKFGLILYEKPKTNTWNFQLEDWEDFDFFYQDTLENNWKNSNKRQTLQEYLAIRERPDDVVRSYAVYHKTKANHEIGKTNYKIGKFCHIFRPKFIDADDKFEWAKLHIENGVYTISVSQFFLDNANYPIRVNDTWGYESGASTNNISIWSKPLANVFADSLSPSTGGTITKYTAKVLASATTKDLRVSAYSVSANLPDSRLAAPVTIISTTVADWRDSAAISQTMVNGITYTIGIGSQDDYVKLYYDWVSGDQNSRHDTVEDLPASWSHQDYDNDKLSGYATWEAAAADEFIPKIWIY